MIRVDHVAAGIDGFINITRMRDARRCCQPDKSDHPWMRREPTHSDKLAPTGLIRKDARHGAARVLNLWQIDLLHGMTGLRQIACLLGHCGNVACPLAAPASCVLLPHRFREEIQERPHPCRSELRRVMIRVKRERLIRPVGE
jgi:hypothetical protein